jgi:hypothetical protein
VNHTESSAVLSVVVAAPGYPPAAVTTPLFTLDDRARPSPSLARFALGPVSLVIASVLLYGNLAPRFVAMCIVGAGLIAFQWASVLANGARDAYDRAAVAALAKGKGNELLAKLDGALAFRLFGPRAEWNARRGAALAAAGKTKEAADAWADALAGYPAARIPRSIALGFAAAAFEAGWSRDASRAYRTLFESDPELPRVRTRLAHALARLGEDLEESDALLAVEEKKAKVDVETTVARAAWLAASKKPKAARAKLEGLDEIPPHLEAEVAALREKPKSSKPPKARKSSA